MIKVEEVFSISLKLCRAVPDRVLILNYVVDNIPYVHHSQRYEITCLHEKVFNLTLHYGFMETISIPRALERASNKNLFPFKLNIDRATYMVEIPNISASKTKRSLTFSGKKNYLLFNP